MKKRICALLLCALSLSLAACTPSPGAEPEKPIIVCTIFPQYDWIRNLLGEENMEGVELRLLMDKGVDLHSYQATAQDMVYIADSSLFVYVGGSSDIWVEDALNSGGNAQRQSINLLQSLGAGAKEEELAEGMEAEAHDHDGGAEGIEYDEHIWLSLKNAAYLCKVLQDALCALLPERAESIGANAQEYIAKLEALDGAYFAAVASAAARGHNTLLFADRFPFRYLTDDYGLSYYAAFPGCSAESEAGFETIVFLADRADDLDIPVLLTIEGSDGRIAEAVRDNTRTQDQRILAMDAMQSVTQGDIEAGCSYLGIMESNLDVLREALR